MSNPDFSVFPEYPKDEVKQPVFISGAVAGWNAAFNKAFNESPFKRKSVEYTLGAFLVGSVVGYALQFV